MPTPFLSTLTKRARLAYPIIQRGVREGLSSRAISNTLKAGGVGIRRNTLLDIMRRERDVWEHGQNLRYLPLDRRPNPSRLPEALTRIRRNYSYEVFVTGIDTSMGVPRGQYVTVASSKLLTRREAETLAIEYAGGIHESGGIEIEKAQLNNILRAGPLGTLF